VVVINGDTVVVVEGGLEIGAEAVEVTVIIVELQSLKLSSGEISGSMPSMLGT